MNKLIKILCSIGIHIGVALEIYVVSLITTSPFMALIVCILDTAKLYQKFMLNRFLIIWLLISAVLWLSLYTYVEVHSWKERHHK